MTISVDILVGGLIDGLLYALLGAGVLITFRVSGILNFAIAATGSLAGYLVALLTTQYSVPLWASMPVAVIAGGVVAGLGHALFLRRLRDQAPVAAIVATIGLGQLITLITLSLPALRRYAPYPTVIPSSTTVHIGAVTLQAAELQIAVVVPVVTMALAFVFQRTRYGLIFRAIASNREGAELNAVPVRRYETVVWTIAGVAAAVVALLVGPARHADAAAGAGTIGPQLLFFALAVAGLAETVPAFAVLAIGPIVGVANRLVTANIDMWHLRDLGIDRGVNIALTFAVLFVVFAFRPRARSVSMPPVDRFAPAGTRSAMANDASARRRVRVIWCILAAAGLATPFFIGTPSMLASLAQSLILGAMALSAVIVVGWMGQLSLAQGAIGVVGALVSAAATQSHGILFAITASVLMGAATGATLAWITNKASLWTATALSLGFAVLVSSWVAQLEIFHSGRTGRTRVRPLSLLGMDLATNKRGYYLLALALLVVTCIGVSQLRKSRFGASLLASRDNPQALTFLGGRPALAPILGGAIAGCIAATAGALLIADSGTFIVANKPLQYSLVVLSIVVVGGIGSVQGAVMATALLLCVPTLFEAADDIQVLSSGVGALIVLMYAPRGLGALSTVRLFSGTAGNDATPSDASSVDRTHRTAAAVSRHIGVIGDRTGPSPIVRRRPDPTASAVELGTALELHEVSVQIDETTLLAPISMRVAEGEIVGVLGPNGSGKTTLLNAICGLSSPTVGRIEMFQRDITNLAPQQRHAFGLTKTFQFPFMFPALTPYETIRLAAGKSMDRRDVEELLDFFNLIPLAHTSTRQLSTGTRRTLEVVAALTQKPRIILLDEPTGGLASVELAGLELLLVSLNQDLGITLVITDHDHGFVHRIAHKAVWMFDDDHSSHLSAALHEKR